MSKHSFELVSNRIRTLFQLGDPYKAPENQRAKSVSN